MLVKPQYLTEDKMKKILALISQGVPLKDISREMGRCYKTIRDCCVRNGFERFIKRKQLKDDEISTILDLARQNISVSEIARQTGFSRPTIREYCIKANILNFKPRNIYSNLDFFNTIDTESKAYWLGLLYADGYVREQQDDRSGGYGNLVQLTLKDREHVQKFADIFGADVKPMRTCYTCLVFSKQMVRALLGKGIYTNRCHIEEMIETPSFVPLVLMHHFIRGFLDGDGTIYLTKCRSNHLLKYIGAAFDGNYYFLEWLRDYLILIYKMPYVKIHFNGSIWHFGWLGKAVSTLLDHLYKDATVYLERKFDIFMEYKKSITPQNEQNKILTRTLRYGSL